MTNLLSLIRKRHDGPAWVVLPELANGTGYKVSNHADACALGIWPSRGYEFHGYECKVSRGDVQKELNNPRKADGVGKYCDFWWLVVDDLKIIDGLIVPETWGILAPKAQVLRVHRKAPKLEAKPFDRALVAAIARNITGAWVPRDEHNQLRETQRETLLKELERDRKWQADDTERELRDLKASVAAFEKASGVEIGRAWAGTQIGEAVKIVRDWRHQVGGEAFDRHLETLEDIARQHRHQADNAEAAVAALRTARAANGQAS